MRAKVILLGIESNGIINQTKLDIVKAFIIYFLLLAVLLSAYNRRIF